MITLAFIIILALAFDFVNGWHDAPNSIATVVATKVLTPLQAVVWASFFNFVAFFIAKYIIGEFGIADTMSKIVAANAVPNPSLVVITGLTAAIIWSVITWLLGIPSSASHTLIGGLAGAAFAAAGIQAVHWGVIGIIAIFIFIAPLMGFISGNIITIITMHLFKDTRPIKAELYFKRLQLISSALLSIGHGLNDSQKVIGIIALALMSATASNPEINEYLYMSSMDDMHDWIPIACFTAIAVGTLCGGWKILKTMGNKITRIYPFEGFSAQAAGAITLFITEALHVPVSTTHVISGSIIGVGSVKRLSAVRWGVTKNLLVAWVLTIPVSALLGALIFWMINFVLKMV
ncbi:MAG: inorganic phosphate transporter [Lactobacillaceae bacterium]|jgi:PiT family inorganic phosphate transporter|nr:inorganic phosphate transporter [Lactobacillaceae bacterium]